MQIKRNSDSQRDGELSGIFRIIKEKTGKEPQDFNTADMSAILEALGNPLGILP